MLNFIQNCFKFLSSLFKNIIYRKKIFYVIEYKKWANFNDSINLKKFFKGQLIISNEIYGIKNSIIHLGTHYKLLNKNRFINIDKTNKLIVFWPHFDNKNYITSIIKKNLSKIHMINTCSINTKKNLVKYGIPKKKIFYTPLSVDTKIFNTIRRQERIVLREKFSIPEDKLILGSFVKDGVGFKRGLAPKTIKNPKMLINALKTMVEKKKLFFVLSGPARGYIKKELKKIGVDFFHKNCSSQKELARLYKLVDATIINSNNEGGPYSLLESLASGAPVISTKVGMSSEIVKDNINGYIIKINNHKMLAKKIRLLFNKKRLDFLKTNSKKSIKNYSISSVGKNYFKKIYNLV